MERTVRWDDGYVTDVVYIRNAYREITPLWLATAALLQGQQPPELSRPFRYVDLGCGHGLTTAIIAATYPQAEVWGFDFNPSHIASARDLACRAGLTNVRFEEKSFADLAALPASGLPNFDFVVAHGVLSWVSRESREHIARFIEQRLRPGGLAAVSYNVATGYAAMGPLQSLVQSLMRFNTDPSDEAASGMLDYLEVLKDCGAAFFDANPMVVDQLAALRTEDPAFVAHDLLNAAGQPLMFREVAGLMDKARCVYIGSATLTDNVDAFSVPPDMRGMIEEAPDAIVAEILRDLGLAKGFRRDIYRRGAAPLHSAVHTRLVDGITLQWTGKPFADPILLGAPYPVEGLGDVARDLLHGLSAGPRTVGGLRTAETAASRPISEFHNVVSLVIANGYAHPAMPASIQSQAQAGTTRLNLAIGTMNANGANLGHLAAAAIGSSIPATSLDTLLVREKLVGEPLDGDRLVDRMLALLAHSGRAAQQNGRPVSDLEQSRQIAGAALRDALDHRMPVFASLGVFDEAT